MAERLKVWQTTIWLNEAPSSPVVIYGESISHLQQAVAEWLHSHLPPFFSNAPPNYNPLKHIRDYFYSDGTRDFQIDFDRTVTLPPGWYYTSGSRLYPTPKSLPDFDSVVAHFLEHLIIKEGPDYKELAVQESSSLSNFIPVIYSTLFGVFAAFGYLAYPTSDDPIKEMLLSNFLLLSIFLVVIAALFGGLGFLIQKLL